MGVRPPRKRKCETLFTTSLLQKRKKKCQKSYGGLKKAGDNKMTRKQASEFSACEKGKRGKRAGLEDLERQQKKKGQPTDKCPSRKRGGTWD